ncbi:hypothetical protein FRB90_000560 [Tulasnella sp. 427]|nr:hypothetical protein FRB90_000560 [Tulasnella sp. 427]
MDTLAVELVHLIALHVAIPHQSAVSPRPPKDLISLLCTSSSLYSALNPQSNPHLYAEIFRRTFDTSALYRRFPISHLTAPSLTHELKRRWTCLSRVRALSATYSNSWKERSYRRPQLLEDLMTLYIMFTESDTGNAKLLLRYANVQGYINMYKHYRLDKLRMLPDMPEESEEIALWLWLCWFTFDYDTCINEEDSARRNFDYLITPFVLGVFQYANTYAPWTYPILPLSTPLSPSNPSHPALPLNPAAPSLSPPDRIPLDPRPLSTAIPGGYLSVPAGIYGSPSHGTNRGTNGVRFSFPLPHHAAVQLCLSREDRLAIFQQGFDRLSPAELVSNARRYGFFPSASSLAQPDPAVPPFRDDRGQETRDAFTPSHMRVKFPCIVDSRRWDREWARLTGCRDPKVCLLREIDLPTYQWTPGRMTGVWDGRFMIPHLEGFNRLLVSLTSPVNVDDEDEDREYPVNILEDVARTQTFQSWSLTEYHHRPTAQLPFPITPGQAINAHLPNDFVVERTATYFDPMSGRWKTGIIVRANNGTRSFYEAVIPSDGVSVPPSTSGLPIIVFGRNTTSPATSPAPVQNSWFQGGANAYGIVRPWDGLVTLKVSGAAQATGDFVFNGYLVGEGDREWESGNWVGRWRDAHSQPRMVAWEGVFVMRKRGD